MQKYSRKAFFDLKQKLADLSYEEVDDPNDESFHEESSITSVIEEDSIIEDDDITEPKVTFRCKYYISKEENVTNNLEMVKVSPDLQSLLDYMKKVFPQPEIPFSHSNFVAVNFSFKFFKYFRVLEGIMSKDTKEFNEIYIKAPHFLNLSILKGCIDYPPSKRESEYTFSSRMFFWLARLCTDRKLIATENLKTVAKRKHQLWCRPDIEVPQLAFDIECKLFSLLQKKFEDDLVKILMLPYWLRIESDVGLGALCYKEYMYFIGCKQHEGKHYIQILAKFPTTCVQGKCKIFLFIIDYFVTKRVFQNDELEMITQFFDKYNAEQFSLATHWYEN